MASKNLSEASFRVSSWPDCVGVATTPASEFDMQTDVRMSRVAKAPRT